MKTTKHIYFYNVKGTTDVYPTLATAFDFDELGFGLSDSNVPCSSIMEIEVDLTEVKEYTPLPLCKLCGSENGDVSELEGEEYVSCSNDNCPVSNGRYTVEEWNLLHK